MIQKEFLKIKLADLIPYANNPRDNEDAIADVAESIKQCGDLDPIEVDENNVILSGHTRLKALKRRGETETDVIRYTGLTEEQKKKYRLLANKTGEKAKWNEDLLALELDGLDFEGFDFGFPEEETQEAEVDVLEDEAPEPEEDEETLCQPGDVWKLGRHRLICGDSTDQRTIWKLMQGETADLYLTDPPYNVDYVGKTKDALKIQNDAMSAEMFRSFLEQAFAAADGVLKPGGAFYIWHADSEGLNFRQAAENTGWRIRQCLIWNKNVFVMGRQDYQWKHEPCLYGWKEGAAHYFIDDRTLCTVIPDAQELQPRKMKKEELVAVLENILAQQTPTSVIDENRPSRSEEHPTMKPVKLMARLIRNSNRPDEIVLDSFAGSGSTMIAAEQLSRSAYMVELDPHYCDVIIKRWERFSGEPAERIVAGEEAEEE